MGHDALENSNMFVMNNSNPMFVAMTNMHPNMEGMQKVLSGLNEAIMTRLEVNMSDPQTASNVMNTTLKDAISGGKDIINGERGQFNIANGIADFLKGMAAQMSGKVPNGRGPPTNQWSSASPPASAAPVSSSHSRSKRQFGPEKPKPPIPATGPWTPLMQAVQESGPTLSAGMKKMAMQTMNSNMAMVRQAFPVYDFYSIYNAAICWGNYKPAGPQVVACGSSSDWKDIDMTANTQRMIQLAAPNAKVVGPIGLGRNYEIYLGAVRILAMIMYISKVLTIVFCGLSMVASVIGIIIAFKGIAPPGKAIYLNFMLSAAATGMVAPNALGTIMSLAITGVMMPPMGDIMSVQIKLGWKFLILTLVGMIFSVVGTLAWHKMWKTIQKMEQVAKEARQREDSLEHGEVTEVRVHVEHKA
jgi:hypothetical protein